MRALRITGAPVALAAALLSLGAVVAYAASPVDQADLSYEFRPADVGTSPAIASLAIARSEPDHLQVTMPCDVPGSQFRSMTLGNWAAIEGATRSPIEYQDLGISLQVGVGDGYAFLSLGGTEIFRHQIVHTADCMVSAEFDEGMWDFTAGAHHASTDAGHPRFAEALFHGPAATSEASSVVVTTRELGSSPSDLQVMWAIAALILGGVAIARLIAVDRPDSGDEARSWSVPRSAPDLMVFVGLVVSAFLIPAGFDDGWVVARQAAYDTHGAFSNLFDLDAAVLPLGHWVEWLQRFWHGVSSTALIARLPMVVLSGLTWVVLRRLHRSPEGGEPERVSVWVMALTFLVGVPAWNITLRPEPIVAFLLVASVGCAVKATERITGRLLAAWAAVIALAVTAHSAGLVVAAPLMMVIPALWRWGRGSAERRAALAAFAVIAMTLTLGLLFVDSNLDTRFEAVDSLQAGDHDKSVLDERLRYEFLGEPPYGSVLRRSSVALIVLAVPAGLMAWRRGGRTRIAVGSLPLALALLALTPSKWSWHFGGLVALAALVLSIGLEELRRSRPRPIDRKWLISAGLGLGVAGLAAWSWRVATPWTALDLRTQAWSAGATNVLPFDLGAPAVWLVALAVTAAAWWVLRQSSNRPSIAQMMVALLCVSGLSVTTATLGLDVVRTSGWTFGGQNVASLWGGSGCGLGDEVSLPRAGSLSALGQSPEPVDDAAQAAASEAGFASDATFSSGAIPAVDVNGIRPQGFIAERPVAGMADVGSWIEGTGPRGAYTSDWYVVGEGERVAIMLTGAVWDWDPDGNAVALQWGRSDGSSVVSVGIDHAPISGYFLDWTFVPFEPRPDADRVRVLLRDARSDPDWGWVASSMPLGFETHTLAAAKGADVVVSPALGMYFPCLETAGLDGAVAPVPGIVINMWRVFWETTFAAAGASDRYFRVPVELEPPLRSAQIGAHLGDADSLVFVSQEYLTGTPARVNGVFTLVEG